MLRRVQTKKQPNLTAKDLEAIGRWLDEDASVGAESDAKIKLAKAKENASKPALGNVDGEEEDNSIQVYHCKSTLHRPCAASCLSSFRVYPLFRVAPCAGKIHA